MKLESLKSRFLEDRFVGFFTDPTGLQIEILSALQNCRTNYDSPVEELHKYKEELIKILADYKSFVNESYPDKGDPKEHRGIILSAQTACQMASLHDGFVPLPAKIANLVIETNDINSKPDKYQEYLKIHKNWRNNLEYIAKIWSTINQVNKGDNFTEFSLWEDMTIEIMMHFEQQ